jgi:hypothetical protein
MAAPHSPLQDEAYTSAEQEKVVEEIVQVVTRQI